eukprot:jgi/Chlat1/6364/Chrsp44S05826
MDVVVDAAAPVEDTVIVDDIGPNATVDAVRSGFAQFGKVKENGVRIYRHPLDYNVCRAFVTFENPSDAVKVVQELKDNLFILTSSPRPATARLAPRKDPPPPPPPPQATDCSRTLSTSGQHKAEAVNASDGGFKFRPRFAEGSELAAAREWVKLAKRQRLEKCMLQQRHEQKQLDLHKQCVAEFTEEREKLNVVQELKTDDLVRNINNPRASQLYHLPPPPIPSMPPGNWHMDAPQPHYPMPPHAPGFPMHHPHHYFPPR